MTPPDTRVHTWTVVAAVVFAAVLFAIGVVVSSYPAVCASCHVPQAHALAASPHAGVACYDCHLAAGGWSIVEAKAGEFFSMYPAYLLRRPISGSGVRISRAACVACHEKILIGVTPTKMLRIRHSSCSPPPTKCDGCHSDVAHGNAVRWQRLAGMDDCIACHVSKKATTGCDSCHAQKVLAGGSGNNSLRVTHGPNWKTAHGLGDLRTCAACHGDSACVRCHGTAIPHPDSFMAVHGTIARKSLPKCAVCHKDQSACDRCHGIPMPHPADFRPKHSKVAKSSRDRVCLKCHTKFDCDNCHTGHMHPGSTRGFLGQAAMPRSARVK